LYAGPPFTEAEEALGQLWEHVGFR
jgi:hypothetical protein